MTEGSQPVFPWIGEIIAATSAVTLVVGAWLRDRLGINNRFGKVEETTARLEAKVDLLIKLQTEGKNYG